jgi:hypothetical protein
MPPPTVDEPVAQIEPSEPIRHCTRLAAKTVKAVENSLNPPGRPGLLGLATATDETVTQSANAATIVRIRMR